MKFILRITVYELDKEGYKTALKKYMEEQMKLAAREFAKVALSKIPVRTGFVSGAFGTLTDLVGGGARLNPVVTFTRKVLRAAKNFLKRESEAAKNQTNKAEYYYIPGGGKILKTPTSGREFATPTDKIFVWEGDALIFNYNVDITYFRVNELVPGHSPTAPWGAFLAAEAAMREYLEKFPGKNKPKIETFLVPRRINVG